MQKLITDLRQLLIDRSSAGINIGNIIIDTYHIKVKIICDVFFNSVPSTIPSDYIVTVQIHNTISKGTIHSQFSPEYEVLPGLRENIILAVDRHITPANKVEKIVSEKSSGDESLVKQQKVRQWYQSEFCLTERQMSLLESFHSPLRTPFGYTHEEVLLCIYLHPIRTEHRKICSVGAYPAGLHPALFVDIDENISRTDALRKAVFDMHMDLVKYQPPPSYS